MDEMDDIYLASWTKYKGKVCPWCNNSGRPAWYPLIYGYYHDTFKKIYGKAIHLEDAYVSICRKCSQYCIWVDGKQYYPAPNENKNKRLPVRTFKDKFGEKIYFSNSRYRHVIQRHPAVIRNQDKIGDVLTTPDGILEVDEPVKNVSLYYKKYGKEFLNQYFVVAVKRGKKKHYISTAYITTAETFNNILKMRATNINF